VSKTRRVDDDLELWSLEMSEGEGNLLYMKLKWIKLKNGKEILSTRKKEKKVRVFGAIEKMLDGRRIVR
jgi:hypothetical protein